MERRWDEMAKRGQTGQVALEICSIPLMFQVKWASGRGLEMTGMRFPKCHVDTMLFSPAIRALSTLHVWYKCKWTSCWTLPSSWRYSWKKKMGGGGCGEGWGEVCGGKVLVTTGEKGLGEAGKIRGEQSRKTLQECKSVLRCEEE